MDWLWPLLAAPFIGSFLGVLIRRLPHGSILTPARSHCESCATPLRLRDMVPLLSALALRGRCRTCAAPIAPQHWHVELAALAIPATAALAGLEAPALWPLCLLGWTHLALAWIDWDCLLLPDILTLPLVLAGLAATAWLDPDLTTDHAIAAALAYGAVQALAILYRRLRHRDGIGAGDAKLLAAIGAWTGLESLPWVIMAAAITGLTLAAAMAARGRPIGATTPLPFGTCLAAAGWCAALFTQTHFPPPF